jgi:hypothetical protein
MSLRTLRARFKGIRLNRNGHDSYGPLPYARISTEDQNLNLQTAALESTGAARIFTDKMSGTRTDRPGLQEALSHARAGTRSWPGSWTV